MTINAMFLVSTFSTATGASVVNAADFGDVGVDYVSSTKFTSKDAFANYPMDEIKASLATAEMIIPSHLATADEIDAWIMDL
ncbi:hypothetical protein ABEG75_07920 [Pantoea agglomerans]|uniref:hypothetical protein n=1 Tax=Enterobacter agglomerans TaxID=549 RepID=UPI001654682C|nr:hypothetical protein [Pantoea agglomerans]